MTILVIGDLQKLSTSESRKEEEHGNTNSKKHEFRVKAMKSSKEV